VAAEVADEPLSQSTQFEAIQAKFLNGSLGRETIDKLAVEFAFLNSKSFKKRLVKFIIGHAKTRNDLTASFARLIAILNPYFPDIGTFIVDSVDNIS
jgi:regulator of nonsense transcripts 2